MLRSRPVIIDALQYCNWSSKIFQEMAEGGLDAVHVTICYHENFQETIQNIETWNRHFRDYSHRIVQGRCADDVLRAKIDGKTAIFFGLQNCTSIEGVLDRIEICYQLGVRFMQLSYNNQSLLATGCYENEDTGVTRMGRQVIREMNRVGLVIDMSHSAERSTLEAIEYSTRPIAITHANSASWHPVLRNKSDEVLKALASSGGMIGFSLYPHHLKDNSECTLDSFCEMVSDVAEKIGIDHIGVGSDLCQDQPDSVVSWMRNGSWTRDVDYGEGSENTPGFPDSPIWFGDNRDFPNLTQGLLNIGFSESDVGQIMGGNWLEFFRRSFGEDEQK